MVSERCSQQMLLLGRRLLSTRAPTSHQPSTVVKFKDLGQFIKTKTTLDEAHVRQLMMHNHFQPVKYLGKGRFGKVFLCEYDEDAMFAIKVLNVERDRREYNWTWLTLEERQESKKDCLKLKGFIDGLQSGLVKDHMVRAQKMMLDTLKREENPLLRRVRRPVAEREILARIGSHPFVANLETSFRDNRFMCLVFEYFPGGTLQKLMTDNEKLDEKCAMFYAAQLLLALEFLALKNVSHRDVKPSNLLMRQDGFIALADFGLATRLRGGLKTFCGTAEYIAPEVLSEKMWSASGLDLWAFGITLYQILVGKTPFEAPNATSVFLNTLTSQLKFPEHLSNEAKDLLTKVLCKEASGRPTIEQIRAHAFFKSTNWEALSKRDKSCIPKTLPPIELSTPEVTKYALSSFSSLAGGDSPPPPKPVFEKEKEKRNDDSYFDDVIDHGHFKEEKQAEKSRSGFMGSLFK